MMSFLVSACGYVLGDVFLSPMACVCKDHEIRTSLFTFFFFTATVLSGCTTFQLGNGEVTVVEPSPVACAEIVSKTIWENYARAFRLFDVSQVYTKLGANEKSARLRSAAYKIVQTIANKTLRAKSLAEFSIRLHGLGEIQKSSLVRSEAFALVATFDHDYLKTNAWGELAKRFSAAGQFDYALKAIDSINDQTLRVMPLIKLAQKFGQRAAKERALKTLAKALTMLTVVSDVRLKRNALAATALAYNGLASYARALKTAQSVVNDEVREKLIVKIAVTMARDGKITTALDSLKTCKNDHEKGRGLAQIVAHYVAQKNEQAAFATLRLIRDPFPKVWAYIALSQLYGPGSRQASEQLQRSFEEANKITGKILKPWGLSKVSLAYAQADDFPRALQTLALIEAGVWKNNALTAISGEAMTFKKMNLVGKQLLKVVDTMASRGWRFDALAHLSKVYAQAGDFKKALALADKIGSKHKKSATRAHIMILYAQAGNFEQVLALATPKATPYVMTAEYAQSNALEKIAMHYHDQANLGRALKIATFIKDAFAQARVLIAIAAKYAELGIQPTIRANGYLRDIVRSRAKKKESRSS